MTLLQHPWATSDVITADRINLAMGLGAIKGLQQDITTTEQTPYTVPGSGVAVAILWSIHFCNNDTVVNNVKIALTPGASLTDARLIFDGDVQSKENIVLKGPWFLDPSDTIKTDSDTASANEVGAVFAVTEIAAQPTEGTLLVQDGDDLTASLVTKYTCPTGESAQVWAITIWNHDTVSRVVEVHAIQSGGSATGSNKIIDLELLAQSGYIHPFPVHLVEDGDFIQAKAAAASQVAFRLSPIEATV